MNPYRQGDVFLHPIKEITITKEAGEDQNLQGKTILAYGEATGHHHFFDKKLATKYSAIGCDQVEVIGEKTELFAKILERKNKQVTVLHPRWGRTEFAEADVEIEDDQVKVDGYFAPLYHQEHDAIAVKKGKYQIPPQYEYKPEDIRKVRD